jgi:hypothetical protein
MSLNPEQVDHINLVNWFSYNFPELSDDFHHFANERSCSAQQGRLLKRMGVKRGVSDFFLGVACGQYHGLWVELKTGKGKLSAEQIKFLERKKSRGYMAAAVWGVEPAIEIIKSYLKSNETLCYQNDQINLYKSFPIC